MARRRNDEDLIDIDAIEFPDELNQTIPSTIIQPNFNAEEKLKQKSLTDVSQPIKPMGPNTFLGSKIGGSLKASSPSQAMNKLLRPGDTKKKEKEKEKVDTDDSKTKRKKHKRKKHHHHHHKSETNETNSSNTQDISSIESSVKSDPYNHQETYADTDPQTSSSANLSSIPKLSPQDFPSQDPYIPDDVLSPLNMKRSRSNSDSNDNIKPSLSPPKALLPENSSIVNNQSSETRLPIRPPKPGYRPIPKLPVKPKGKPSPTKPSQPHNDFIPRAYLDEYFNKVAPYIVSAFSSAPIDERPLNDLNISMQNKANDATRHLLNLKTNVENLDSRLLQVKDRTTQIDKQVQDTKQKVVSSNQVLLETYNQIESQTNFRVPMSQTIQNWFKQGLIFFYWIFIVFRRMLLIPFQKSENIVPYTSLEDTKRKIESARMSIQRNKEIEMSSIYEIPFTQIKDAKFIPLSQLQ